MSSFTWIYEEGFCVAKMLNRYCFPENEFFHNVMHMYDLIYSWLSYQLGFLNDLCSDIFTMHLPMYASLELFSQPRCQVTMT